MIAFNAHHDAERFLACLPDIGLNLRIRHLEVAEPELLFRQDALHVGDLGGNLGIAFAYSAFGDYAQQNQWLPLALGVSIALPVVLAFAVQRWLRGRDGTGEKETERGLDTEDTDGTEKKTS